MSDLQVATVALLGGLQDSKAIPESTDQQTLTNFMPFRGRFALRAPVMLTATLKSDPAHEASVAINAILAIRYHKQKLYVVGHRAGGVNRTYLYRLEVTGLPEGGGADATPIATVWTGATAPNPIMTSFQGGSATTNVDRLYISDVDGGNDTVYWNDSTIVNVTEDLNDDNTKENLRFNVMLSYNYHLMGTGFLQGGASVRNEMLRISRPGLIAENEPDVTYNPSREWWSIDRRSIGTRGEAVTGYGYAGGSAILTKRRQVYALFGSDINSFAVRLISEFQGAVGHRAIAFHGGLTFGWGDNGPWMTDGQQLIDIGKDIRKTIQDVGFSTDIQVGVSPDEGHKGLVYFWVPAAGGTDPSQWVAFDISSQRFTTGAGYKAAATALDIGALGTIADDSLSGPTAAPSSLVATGSGGSVPACSQIDLAWVNGDTSLQITTDIHRGTSTGFAINEASRIATVGSGVASYANDGLAQSTTYYYVVRHKKNSIYSANSNEDNERTWLAEPTGLVISAGNPPTNRVLDFTNNSNLADIKVERATGGGGEFTLIDTMPAQVSGATQYIDTTASGFQTYRVKASKAGETDSEYSNEEAYP